MTTNLPRLGVSPHRAPQLAARVVFVDWHGVLSDDPFWWTILEDEGHWFRSTLATEVTSLFTHRRPLVEAWMRGHTTAPAIVDVFPRPADNRCSETYLLRRLKADCVQMRTRGAVIAAMQALPALTPVVIATDNMDCFAESVGRIPALRSFYGILCSSDLGVLKAEDPERFFGPFLRDHGLRPRDALLVDDSGLNCQAFEAWGGSTVQFDAEDPRLSEVRSWAAARHAVSP